MVETATGFMKHGANSVTKRQDDKVDDSSFKNMIMEPVTRQLQLRSLVCVKGKEINVWFDANSLITGNLLGASRSVIKEGCWLHPVHDAQHIKLIKLDATLKGIKLAPQCQAKVLHLMTNSLRMYHWISDTLTSKPRVNTKTASEMLIRRLLNTLK